MQTEMALRMTHAGLEVERVDADPSQLAGDPDFPGMEAPRTTLPVVAGAVGLASAPRRVIIAGHIDTVVAGPARGLEHRPVRRRSCATAACTDAARCDMKGGVVAGLAALRALVDTETELGGEAVLVTVPSEEDGGAGMLAAIRAGYVAEMAVITEPTRLEIVTAQAGAITFLLTVSGRSAHAAYRLKGVSAIEKLRVIHDGLLADERERNESEQNPAMRELGLPYPTNLGRISGGDWSSTVPDRVTVEGRYGVRVGETPSRPSRRCETPWPPPVPATSGCATTPPRSRSPAGASPRRSCPTPTRCPGAWARQPATCWASCPPSWASPTAPTCGC